MKSCTHRIPWSGDGLFVFTTTEDSFHGHPDPLRCRPVVARRSLVLSYFTVEQDPVARATNHRPRPGDGWKRLGIATEPAVGVYDKVKRRLSISEDAVQVVLRRVKKPAGRAADDDWSQKGRTGA